MMQLVRQTLPWTIVCAIVVLVGVALFHGPGANAQTVRTLCHAAIVIDRSGSVGEPNLVTIRNQIQRLFQPTGIYDDLVQLAFWSFSSTINRNSNYDAPFHGFVSSRGVNSSFMTELNRIVSAGGTNYEQGFAYDRGVANTYDNMEDIVDQADIIVFMTDGVPNSPGQGDNNATARNAARSAVLEHKANNKVIVGGILGNVSQASLNFVINGSNGNATDIFRISDDYSDLSEKLTEAIERKCSELLPPGPTAYNLEPRVVTDDRVASGNGSINFRYYVNNESDGVSSRQTEWSLKRVVVPRNQSVANITTNFSNAGGDPYRDSYSCPQIMGLLNNQGSCTDVTDGQLVYGPGDNDMQLYVGNAGNVVIDDSWNVGTKVCFILTLNLPTNRATPTDRFSRAACTTIGKRPFVQVHGGDVKVGRYFAGEVADDQVLQRADISTSTVLRNDGQTYGSWAEYGVFTPGVVSGFASSSGLQGGSNQSTQQFWSTLTFANVDNEYGLFTDANATQGTIPDVIGALITGKPVERELVGNAPLDLSGDVDNGIYQKETGNLEIEASAIAQNKSLIVYVPAGTVLISGDIRYDDGPYTSIKQIPQLVIIAQNIVIDDSVENVDAWLIATGDETDGIINTCNRDDPLTVNICDEPLTINGPVMARELLLRRTGSFAPSPGNPPNSTPAEIINLPANTYLWSHTEGRSEMRAQTTYTIERPPFF